MVNNYFEIYGNLRQKILSQNFALGRYYSNNYMSNGVNCGKSGYATKITPTVGTVINLLKIVCLKKSSVFGSDTLELHVTIDGSKRPTLIHEMDDSSKKIWDINLKYRKSNLSTLKAFVELQKQRGFGSNDTIGKFEISSGNCSNTPSSFSFDNGDCRYELQYQITLLDEREVGVMDGLCKKENGGILEPGDLVEDLVDDSSPKSEELIVNHGRENPLIASGQLLSLMAIEYYLGNLDAAKIIQSALTSIDSLYKYKSFGNDFEGYIIRWDAVTSDLWQEEIVGDKIVPKHCFNFLTDEAGNILYCTPFDHPDYVTQENDLDNIRYPYFVRYRHFEPSMDEIIGLLMGYDMVYRFVNNSEIKDMVRAQVNRLGNYLAAHAYLLARPLGGFACRGAAGPNPAFEFVCSEIFYRITGNRYQIRSDWISVVDKAGIWQHAKDKINGATLGFLAGAAGIAGFAPILEPILFEAGLDLRAFNIFPWDIAFAAAIIVNKNYFDVQSDSRKTEEQDSFAISYLLLQISTKDRISLWLNGVTSGIGGFAKKFPRFWGFPSLQIPSKSDNSDILLNKLFLNWYDWYYQLMQKYRNGTENEKDYWNDNHSTIAWDCALALLNKGEADLEARLVSILNDVEIFSPSTQEAGMGDNELNYLCAIATSWLYAKLQQEKGITVSYNLPSIPSCADWSTLPAPSFSVHPKLDTYVISDDSIVGNSPLDEFVDKKGTNGDLGIGDITHGLHKMLLIVAYPRDFNALPLGWFQAGKDPNHLLVDSDNKAMLLRENLIIQKPNEPSSTFISAINYKITQIEYEKDFNETNLGVSIGSYLYGDDSNKQINLDSFAYLFLNFGPDQPGIFNGSLKVHTDNPEFPMTTFTLTAQITAPKVEAVPPVYDPAILGQSRVQSKYLVLTNVGGADAYCHPFVLMDETWSGDFDVGLRPDYGVRIPPGSSEMIPIEYYPNHAGISKARLVITVCAANYRYPKQLEVLLEATCKQLFPSLKVNPKRIDFGSIGPNQEAEAHLQIMNSSTADGDLKLTAIYVKPELDFYIDLYRDRKWWKYYSFTPYSYNPSNLPKILKPGESFQIKMIFHPLATANTMEAEKANLIIASNDPKFLRNLRVPLTGSCPQPGYINIEPESDVDFGTIMLPVDPSKVPQKKLILICSGTSPVTISRIYFDPFMPDFTFKLDTPLPFTLQPGKRSSVMIYFMPIKPGTYKSRLRIESNAINSQFCGRSIIGVAK
jgi:hypothetical protein